MEKIALADYDFSKICRLCLKSDVRLYNIFLFSSKLNGQMADAIMKCTSVQINEFDKLPNYICKSCYIQLVNTYQFQIQAMESDKTLRHYLQKLCDKKIELESCVSVFENCKDMTSVHGDKFNNFTSVDRNSLTLISSTEYNTSVNEDNNCSREETEIDRIDIPIKCEAEEISNSNTTIFCEDTKIGLTDTIVNWKDSKRDLEESTSDVSNSKPQIISNINSGNDQSSSNENIIIKCDPFEQIYVKQEKEECDTTLVPPFIEDSKNCQNSEDNLSVNKKQSRYKYTRERSYQCDVCNKYFTQIGHLRDHKRLHTGEKPYQCDICCKSFNQLGHLNTHKLSHTGERPYQCDVCNKNFSQSCHLNRHKLTHTGEKPYQCDICRKCFNQSSSLKNHKRLHTGDKAHQCDVCSKIFTCSDYLTEHKFTCEKLYQCDVCNKTFTQLDHLSTHKLSHSRERPYQCNVCNKTFMQSNHLNRHKLMHTY